MDWDITDASTWAFKTTVDAHMGYHKTGMVMREFRTIETSAIDSGWFDPANPVNQEAAEWWYGVLEPYHRALVAIAIASPEQIDRAAERLGADPGNLWDAPGHPVDDLEDTAQIADAILEALA